MISFLIIVFGLFMILLGRLMLKNWFNHLILYSFIWTLVLGLYSLRLLKYRPIITEAWIFIFAAWIFLYLGTAVVLFINFNKEKRVISTESSDWYNYDVNQPKNLIVILKILIIGLSIISLISIFSYMFVLLRTFGNIFLAMAQSFLWYHLRVRGEISQGIPYLTSLILVCCSFAGVYGGIKGRITLLSTIPLILAIIYSLISMGRAAILIAITLYITAYLQSYRYFNKAQIKNKVRYWLVPLLLVITLAMFGAEQVRSFRRITESYKKYGESKSMKILRNTPFLTPSVYFYLSGEPVVLSEYLQKDREHVIPGWYTFAPIYRILAKLGLVKKPPYVQPFYLTPVPMNTGTYLREIHADFGVWGIILIPFILGFICTSLFLNRTFRLTNMIIIAHLYVYIVMTFICNAFGLGNWLISFIVSLISARIIEIKYLFPNRNLIVKDKI